MTARAPQLPTIATILVVASLTVFVALVSRGDVPDAFAGGGCPNANSTPNQASKREFVKSITCLINNERTSRGLDPVKGNADLKGIESSHVKKMLAQDCLEHRCNGEGSIKARLFESGYLDGADSYKFGESLGYESTPNEMIDRWMASDYDSGNILNPKLKDFGAAAGFGSPKPGVDDSNFVTYSTILATRKP